MIATILDSGDTTLNCGGAEHAGFQAAQDSKTLSPSLPLSRTWSRPAS